LARNEREDRVIDAHADINARVKLGTALSHDDGASLYDFAGVLLDAESLRIRISAVS
jgi:hypothetical protein